MENPNTADWSDSITSIASTLVERPPSCVEFVPEDKGEINEHFVLGTYNLQENTSSQEQARDGSLLLFRLSGKELELIETVPYPSGILDLHFYEDQKMFAAGSSTGALSIFRVDKNQELYTILHVITHQVLPKDILVLSLAWYSYQSSGNPNKMPMISITASNGGAYIIRFSPDFTSYTILNNGAPLIEHNDNAWTCAISNQFMVSGSDDSRLSHVIFERDALEADGKFKPQYRSDTPVEKSKISQVNFKGHNAGVTAILILCIEGMNSFLLTGSYDDYVRVFVIQSIESGISYRSKILAECALGGGVWRLKIIEKHIPDANDGELEFIVLASCMHAGARILNVKRGLDDSWGINILAEMRAHQSMCYASDVQAQSEPQQTSDYPPYKQDMTRSWKIVSTSFYDRLLRVWEWSPEPNTKTKMSHRD